MMMKTQSDQGGFVLVISLMLLLVTTLMGTMLVINSASQSKLTRDSVIKQQSFLGSETGMQASIKYLQTTVSGGTYPSNDSNNTFETICDYPLTKFYSSAELPFEYAYKTPSFVNLKTEMNLANSEEGVDSFEKQKYEYYLSVLGTAAGVGIGAGGSIGSDSSYSSVGGTTAVEYRIIACGINDTTNARSITETVVEVQ